MTAQHPSPRRRPGRPSRFTRDQIVATAVELLDGPEAETFSIANLAKRLGASPMSLYTYFPSRNALLEAVADAVFREFACPSGSERWQDFVLAWLRELAAHFERHPAALHLIAWDDHLSAGWLHAWLPVLRILAEQEPQVERLTFAISWFSHASVGLIRAHVTSPKRVGRFSADALADFPTEDRLVLADVLGGSFQPQGREMLEFGFRNIIAGLETLIGNRTI